MKNKIRRAFDKSFKLMIVELHQRGESFREIARDFDLHSDMVRRWSREHLSRGSSSFSGHGKVGLTEQERTITELKKALKQAQIERDILKKAVGIFSRTDSKYSGS